MMRRPNQMRLAALLGVLGSLAVGVVVAFIVHVALGWEGRLGFDGVNLAGFFEGVGFVLGFSLGLLYLRQALGLPGPMLLSFGIVAPPSASNAATKVPIVEISANNLHTLAENRLVIVVEGDVPVGLAGLKRERLSPWEELAKVRGEVAVTELRSILAREPLVVVVQGERVMGIITQRMYLEGLWGRPN